MSDDKKTQLGTMPSMAPRTPAPAAPVTTGAPTWSESSAPAQPPAAYVAPPPPTDKDILAALNRVNAMLREGNAPPVVISRVVKIARTIHQTLPRLPGLGVGSYDGYSIMATATEYLPEAVGRATFPELSRRVVAEPAAAAPLLRQATLTLFAVGAGLPPLLVPAGAWIMATLFAELDPTSGWILAGLSIALPWRFVGYLLGTALTSADAMGRRVAAGAEVAGRADDPLAEVPEPDAVDHHPRRQRVVAAGDRPGQLQPAAAVGERLGLALG